MQITPIILATLLRVDSDPNYPSDRAHDNTPGASTARIRLVRDRIIENLPSGKFRLTDKGRAWLRAIQDTAPPGPTADQIEIERLKGVLDRIDGGDDPCTDEALLRQWAYEGLTLGRSADELSTKVRG